MKIQQGTVLLSGQHSHSLLASRQTQASAQIAKDAYGSTQGVRLSLSTQTTEQQRVRASSQVQQQDGSAQFHSAYLAEQATSALTQMSVNVSQWQSGLQQSSTGTVFEISSVTENKSRETLSFEALGKVQTEDGRSIDFMLALDFNRDITQQQSTYFKGKLTLVDPIMINLTGGAVQLTDQMFEFDLLADGSNLGLNKAAQGSGYLVFDRNNDGLVNDGSELFGPTSGNGFAEMRQYDNDGNGWLDENDAIFSQLGVLSFNEQGEAVYQTASEVGLGAIYLGAVSSNYNLLNSQGAVQGQITQTGVALSEQGQTLLVQEVHLRAELPQPAKQEPLIINNVPINQSPINLSQIQPIARLDLRSWVAQSMQNFEAPALLTKVDVNQELQSLAFKSINTHSLSLSLEPEDLDGKLALLRQSVEALKQMQAQQKLLFSHSQPLNIYQNVAANS